MIVVDTNILSELMKSSGASQVVDWARGYRANELFTTAITVAEIRYGIQRLPDGQRRNLLRVASDEAFAAFENQVLPFDTAAAEHYAMVVTDRDEAGLPIDGFDAQIASICRAKGAMLATRNIKDFSGTGVELIDPWRQD